MKKTLIILTVAIVAVVALGLTAFSYVEASGMPFASVFDQPFLHHKGPGNGEVDGKMGGDLRPYLEAATAEILGMTLDEFNAAREDDVKLEQMVEDAGMTLDEFQTAMEAALPGILEQAVADEAITQEQADFILENGLLGPGGFGPDVYGALKDYVDAAFAEILGVSVEELQTARDEGTLDDLIDAAGLTKLEVRMALDEATPDIVAAALADGVITQEQADQILEYGLPLPCHDGPGKHDGPGGHHGHDGFGPGPSDAPTDNG